MIVPIKQIITENMDLPELNLFDHEKAQPFIDRAYNESKSLINNLDKKDREDIINSIKQGNLDIAKSSMDPRFLPQKISGFFKDHEEDPLDNAKRIQQIQSDDLRKHHQQIAQSAYERQHPIKSFIDNNSSKLIGGVGLLAGAGYLYNRNKKSNN